ncbi:MAG: preprotein translocase subunit SecG [Thermodesulfobacteriota bacterium]|nr:preprotein translocase subunit SecG [Thermodesulfobacteriota bacterium]
MTIHVTASILLIVAVLLQSGKGSDIGAVFGGAGSQALFGSVGPADFLNKATRVLVVVFMLTSLTLGYFSFEGPQKSVMETTEVIESEEFVPELPDMPAKQTEPIQKDAVNK